jgi:L-fuculose-phosphate aldolase
MHPAEQIVLLINRIYKKQMTTTSGGNLSILDDEGDIWITPSGIDKGTLTTADICQIKPDGTVIGKHKPSVETPFHKCVYKARPDVKAVLHAHPHSLVSFSLVGQVPNTKIIPSPHLVCGKSGLRTMICREASNWDRRSRTSSQKGITSSLWRTTVS